MLTFREFETQLREAGFSTRAARVIVSATSVRSLDELREASWGDGGPGGTGLHRDLALAPNCGQRVISEVVAFREHGDPRRSLQERPPKVSIQFTPSEMAQIDAWIAQQSSEVGRSEAARRLVLAALAISARV